MAEFLFITPAEMTSTTIMGGNADPDLYRLNIANVQLTVIEPLLGTTLYNKILAEAEAATLSGNYLILYDKFIKPITKYQALAEYATVAGFMLTNGGAFKHAPDNAEIMTKDEKASVSQIYSGLADTYVIRFTKWIGLNPLTEYSTFQDEVNASTSITNRGGWYFGTD